MIKKGIFLVVIFHLFSCELLSKKEENNSMQVAKVNDKILYLDEVQKKLPKKYSKQDSILIVNRYINNWAKEQILFDKAELNISSQEAGIDALLEKYKKDLLINKYKEALVTKKLDTIISNQEIQDFYNQNKNSFKLNEKLIKLQLIQIDKNTTDLKEIEKLFKKNNSESIRELENKELEFKTLYLDTAKYIKFSDVLKFNQVIKDNKDKLKANKYIRLESKLDVFLIQINNIIYRNQIAPLQYVQVSIKQMILHNRKLKVLKELEKNLVNDAIKNGNFKIYE